MEQQAQLNTELQPVTQQSSTKFILIAVISFVVIVVVVFSVGAGYYLGSKNKTGIQDSSQKNATQLSSDTNASVTNTTSSAVTSEKHSLSLTSLPLGDQKYTTSPKVGYIYLCRTQADAMGGGAQAAGPWINQTAKTWDLTQKVKVSGSVEWSNRWSVNSSSNTRTIFSNGYPSHTTGVYPIQRTDSAYSYDRNPNSIKEQSLSFTFPTNPTLLNTPECVGGEVGIMLSGTPLFNGFDAGNRDAVAWEVQDTCSGHPQVSGLYHYHGLSSCLKDIDKSEHSLLMGYAFDGFGIFGPKDDEGHELTTSDLDECHGHTHEIVWDGKKVSIYHYHLTRDFPYSVSCFRGKKTVQGPLGGQIGAQGSQIGQGQRPARISGMPPPPPQGL